MKVKTIIDIPGLGQRCKEARLVYCSRSGRTSDEVAILLGISRSKLYQIEDEKINVDEKHLKDMESLYKVNLID